MQPTVSPQRECWDLSSFRKTGLSDGHHASNTKEPTGRSFGSLSPPTTGLPSEPDLFLLLPGVKSWRVPPSLLRTWAGD